MKATTKSIRELKGKRPIVALTAYDFPTAVFADEAGIDIILVGDSVGTTALGFNSTVPVTVEMMRHHAAAVLRAVPEALVVVDLPFAEASFGFDRVLETCRGFMQLGADAVKIEGGSEMFEWRERLVRAGVPVMGHIGLLPQQFYVAGGYRRQGTTAAGRERLLEDARSVEESGCFACIGELIDADTAGLLCNSLGVPLIGIGCGSSCDGQIIVSHDILGLTPGALPSFVKPYATLGTLMREAFEAYREDVVERRFPE